MKECGISLLARVFSCLQLLKLKLQLCVLSDELLTLCFYEHPLQLAEQQL
jgi:hypothetical protein